MIILICSILLTSVCPPRTRVATQYFISLLWRCAPTPLHYILSIYTRYRRCAPLALRANSAMRLSLCAARCARIACAAHPVLSTLHLFYDYILFVCAGLFCGLSYTILLLCSLCSIMFYNTVSKHSIFYGLIHSFLYLCINKNICLMENEFKYLLMFGEEYICLAASIESANKLAKHLKKNLKKQGKAGFYDIYYDGVLIARF